MNVLGIKKKKKVTGQGYRSSTQKTCKIAKYDPKHRAVV